MAYEVIIKEEAISDMKEAFYYYESQKSGLGERFITALEKRFNELIHNPESYSFIDSQNVLRDIALHTFPYVIVYEINGTEIIVYAIHLTHKNPAERFRR